MFNLHGVVFMRYLHNAVHAIDTVVSRELCKWETMTLHLEGTLALHLEGIFSLFQGSAIFLHSLENHFLSSPKYSIFTTLSIKLYRQRTVVALGKRYYHLAEVSYVAVSTNC